MAAYINRSVGMAFNKSKSSVTAAALAAMVASSSAVAGWGDSAAGDELGNAKALGTDTWARCAPHMADPSAKSYELSYLRSNTMPGSPFGVRWNIPSVALLVCPERFMHLTAKRSLVSTRHREHRWTRSVTLAISKPWSGGGIFPAMR